MLQNLSSYAVNGSIPFVCIVQARDDFNGGRWTDQARGYSPEWLAEIAAEERSVFPYVRIVSEFGTVLATA